MPDAGSPQSDARGTGGPSSDVPAAINRLGAAAHTPAGPDPKAEGGGGLVDCPVTPL